MDLAPPHAPPLARNAVEDRLLALSRGLTPAAKLRQLGEMVDAVSALAAADLASHDPSLDARELLVTIAERRYGRTWVASMLRLEGLRRDGAPAPPVQGA